MDIQLKKKPWYVKYRFYLISALCFLALFIYVIILSLGPKRLQISDEDVTIATVEDGRFLEYVDVEGIVQPILTIKINTMESGFVKEIVREEGAMLRKGDTILVLSNPELLRTIDDEEDEWQRQQRTFQENDLEMQRKSLTLKQQTLDAEYEMKNLDQKLNIAREEYRMGIKSRAELTVAEEECDYKRRKLELQMQSLRHDSVSNSLRQELYSSDLERANKRRSRASQRVSELVVTAPIDGQLSYLSVTPGQQVSSGASIGEIKVLSNYKIHVSLNEYYIDRVSAGLPANISYQQKEFPLVVSKVVPEVKDRSFSADLVFEDEKPNNVRIGKSYRVKIELGQPESAMVIPRGDFYNYTGGRWIYKLSSDGKKAVKQEITVGRQNPRQYEITSGLTAGEKVIVSGYEKFGEAEIISIK